MSLAEDKQLRVLLASGCEQLALPVQETELTRLLAFLELLLRWNRVQKLTTITEPMDMIVRHLLDSFSILPWLQGQRIIDVGSGAGLPGIPLAIVRPELSIDLLDSQARRCRFLFQARTELGLTAVQVIQKRAEDHRPLMAYDTVVSRAFASLPEFLSRAGHLCADRGRILAMKGRLPAQEITEVQLPYNVRACHRLEVPGLDAERHVVEITRSDTHPGDREDA